MHDIDFLPETYRRRSLRRAARSRQSLVVAAFVPILAMTAAFQHLQYRWAKQDLEATQPQHQAAMAQSSRLAAMQQRLRKMRASAELYTYLAYPWPRTRILAGLFEPLPDGVDFGQLAMSRESAGAASGALRSAAQRQKEAESLAKLPAATRDLAQLRQKLDHAHTVVTLSGVTRDSTVLHRYLGVLGNSDLFLSADLVRIEGDPDALDAALRFEARIVLRPGYGQPGGPVEPDPAALAHSDSGAGRPNATQPAVTP
jgi:hypothetical protein